MPEFDTFECEHCGEQFQALPSSEAADSGYCSPACETTARDF